MRGLSNEAIEEITQQRVAEENERALLQSSAQLRQQDMQRKLTSPEPSQNTGEGFSNDPHSSASVEKRVAMALNVSALIKGNRK